MEELNGKNGAVRYYCDGCGRDFWQYPPAKGCPYCGASPDKLSRSSKTPHERAGDWLTTRQERKDMKIKAEESAKDDAQNAQKEENNFE